MSDEIKDGLDLAVIEAKTISFEDGSAVSQQLHDSDSKIGMSSAKDVIRLDYDPAVWSKTPELNTRLRSCIRISARNIAGLSWNLPPIKNESLLTESEIEVINRQTEIVRRVFDKPNPDIPLNEVLYRTWYDKKSVGTGHFEVTRSGNGQIDGIYHAQSKYIYKLRESGWAQIVNGTTKYFKEFGDTRTINANTGEIHDGEKNGALSLKDRATELVSFIEYSPDCDGVGVPPHAAASSAIMGNWHSSLRNKNAQVTDGTPKLIIVLDGASLASNSEAAIEKFLAAGSTNDADPRSNRVLILSTSKQSPTSSGKQSINVIPLTVGTGEDATYQDYRKNNDDEIREAFSISSLFFGSTEGTNRASASVARHITIEQAFSPETQELEYRMNSRIIEDILTHPNIGYTKDEIMIRFKLIRPPASDEVEESEVLSRYIQGGGLAPNDIRRHLKSQGIDLPLWTGAWAELPLFVTLALLKADIPASALGIPDIAESSQNIEELLESTGIAADLAAIKKSREQ